MAVESTIAGRVLAPDGTRVVTPAEILASPFAAGAASADALSDEALAAYCKAESEKNGCEVYVWRDREEYGNANVFNGGSDYEVVEEECFLCVCDRGRETLCERTDHWNEKIARVLERF